MLNEGINKRHLISTDLINYCWLIGKSKLILIKTYLLVIFQHINQ